MTPEQQIIKAATQVFLQKGYHGASIRDIAATAGVNVAMINYYFRSKERLFDMVFNEMFGVLFSKIGEIFSEDRPFFDKIGAVIAQYIDTLGPNPTIPNFVFAELTRNPKVIVERIRRNGQVRTLVAEVSRQVEEQVAQGTIRPIDPVELLINVVSLAVFPFAARTMFTQIGVIDVESFDALMQQRKQTVTQFVSDAIKIEKR